MRTRLGGAGVGAGDHTDGMVEVITLLTAVVSAAAAAVSAWVAVAQWRASTAARAAPGATGGTAAGGGLPEGHPDGILTTGPGGAGGARTDAGGTGLPGVTGRPPQPGTAEPAEPAPSGTAGPTGPRAPTDWVAPRSLDATDAHDPPAPAPAPALAPPPSRTLAVASAVAAVCLALTAAALTGYALELPDAAVGGDLAGAVLSIAMLLSVCGAALAAWVIVTHRSRTAQDRRRAALAFAGSLAPWIALTVVGLVDGLPV